MQLGVVLLIAAGIGATIGAFISAAQHLPAASEYTPPEATKIFSSDNVLLATVGSINRQYVKLDQIPRYLREATVAIEDHRFYEHSGIDLRGIARAAIKDITGFGWEQGGSTITQQLAKNIYLSPEQSITRKIREAVLAVLIEQKYTKDKILELYLNQVFYGSGAHGVEAAARTYFGKSVSELNLAECALIAGLPKAPSKLSPHKNLEGAIRRRNLVLDRMAEFGMITQAEAEQAKAEKPRIIKSTFSNRSLAPYFTDYVKNYLVSNSQLSEDLISGGGLKIYTTLNYQMQKAAEKALVDGVNRAKRAGQMRKSDGNGALVCIDVETGYVRAMVGGTNYGQNDMFNRAVQAKRQPGSAFKAFVYTAAVEILGWDENHIVKGGRFTYDLGNGRKWSPRNYDGKYPGAMTIKQAVARSVNVPAVRTALEVGLQNVITYARLLGITAEIEPYPALAIGGLKYGVRPIEMAAAYAVFANGGYYVKPTPIIRVLDKNDNVVYEENIERKKVLQDRTVKVMDELFRAVVASPSGTAYRTLHNFPEARGKTGTTNNDVDAWFIGYVPNKLVTAVWVGNEHGHPMKKVYGGSVCSVIWRDFMNEAIRVYRRTQTKQNVNSKPETIERKPKQQEPKEPATDTTSNTDIQPVEPAPSVVRVRICDESQLLATKWCKSTHIEEFAAGTEPREYCTIHKQPEGLRLTPPTPLDR